MPLVLVLAWLNVDVILRTEYCHPLSPFPVLLVHDELIASMSPKPELLASLWVSSWAIFFFFEGSTHYADMNIDIVPGSVPDTRAHNNTNHFCHL